MEATARQALERGFCTVDDCIEPAQRNGLCWCHLKAKQRANGKHPDKGNRFPSSRARVEEAIHAVADASAEDDAAYADSMRRFWKATTAWMRDIGWTPPRRKRRRGRVAA